MLRYFPVLLPAIILFLIGTSDPALSRILIYMSPSGNDANDGSSDRPVKTLQRVHEILRLRAPEEDVMVRIGSDQGVYYNQTVSWYYYHPEYEIRFEPDPPDRPAVFVADRDGPPFDSFFSLYAENGEPTNIVFRRLVVQDYVTRAFYFQGDREDPESGWNGSNVIEECVIRNIGNLRMPERWIVYGGITFVNSRNNIIRNCRLIDFANAAKGVVDFKEVPVHDVHHYIRDRSPERGMQSSGPDLPIIAIYVAHHSCNNIICGCTTSRIIGDVVRLRDCSNENIISNNTFFQSGWLAICSTWHCTENCTKNGYECPSWENIYENNIAYGNWNCDEAVSFVDLYPYDSQNCDSIPGYYEKVHIIGSCEEDCTKGRGSRKRPDEPES